MVPKSIGLKLQADDVAATQGSTSAVGIGVSLSVPASCIVEQQLNERREVVRRSVELPYISFSHPLLNLAPP